MNGSHHGSHVSPAQTWDSVFDYIEEHSCRSSTFFNFLFSKEPYVTVSDLKGGCELIFFFTLIDSTNELKNNNVFIFLQLLFDQQLLTLLHSPIDTSIDPLW